jgi:ABC-type Fe3+-siderophore transport system permease subunit
MTNTKIMLVTLGVSLVASLIIMALEATFGVVAVYYAAMGIVAFVGLILPIYQLRPR